jgi:hypothetical protein
MSRTTATTVVARPNDRVSPAAAHDWLTAVGCKRCRRPWRCDVHPSGRAPQPVFAVRLGRMTVLSRHSDCGRYDPAWTRPDFATNHHRRPALQQQLGGTWTILTGLT